MISDSSFLVDYLRANFASAKKCVIFLLSKANADNVTVYRLEGVDY